MMKQKMMANREAYRYLFAIFIAKQLQLLIVKFVFFFLEKAEIGHTWCSVKHDSASNQYRLHA